MEGSGRNRRSVTRRSSISDLFGGEQSNGPQGGIFGPQGSLGDSKRPALARPTPESACREASSREPSGIRKSPSEEHRIENMDRNVDGPKCLNLPLFMHLCIIILAVLAVLAGSYLSKGQIESGNLHGKSQNPSHTHGDPQPCFLSSSLYYGGRDVYCDTSTTRAEGLHGFKKDNQDDDTNTSNLTSASRGNWWQGSLYY